MSASIEKVKKIVEQIEFGCAKNRSEPEREAGNMISLFFYNSQVHVQPVKECQIGFDLDELKHWKEQMHLTSRNSYEHEIICYRKYFRKAVIFVKRIIRKMCRSLMQPIVEEQNLFNVNTVSAVNALYRNEAVTEQFLLGMGRWMEEYEQLYQMCEVLQQEVEELKGSKKTGGNSLDELESGTE